MQTITRRLTFEAGHRLVGHESKCRHLHGHSYKAYITISAPDLDPVGRVIDFSVVKQLVGGWIESHWDHTMILRKDDPLIQLRSRKPLDPVLIVDILSGIHGDKPPYVMDCNPTAENMAKELFDVCRRLLPDGLTVISVRLDETENCSATYTPGPAGGQRLSPGPGDTAA